MQHSLLDLHIHIKVYLQKKAIETTFGVLEQPLGNTRLQVTKLLAAVISANNADVMQELIGLETMQVLLDLFFKYQWNNFLHTQVEMCISAALKAPQAPQETGDCNALCRHVSLANSITVEIKTIFFL